MDEGEESMERGLHVSRGRMSQAVSREKQGSRGNANGFSDAYTALRRNVKIVFKDESVGVCVSMLPN